MADLWINDQPIARNTVADVDATLVGLSKTHWTVIQSFLLEWWNDNDFIEVRTSGSTGKPKKIKLLKKTVAASADKTIAFFGLQSNNRALLCLPVQYIAGKLMLVRAMRCGMRLVATEPSLHPIAELQEPVDFAAMIPTQVSNALEDEIAKNRLAKIEKVLIGGAPLEPKLEKRLQALPNRFFHSYGMTETATHVALREIGKDAPYSALLGVRFSADERGCLMVDADHIAERIVTNDLVEILDHQHFRWLGRIDNAIISGGLKHLPEVLEQKIAAFVAPSFYIKGEPDALLGQRLVLVIEGPPLSAAQCEALRDQLKTVLTEHQIPKAIRFEKNFNRTETGKIIRMAQD